MTLPTIGDLAPDLDLRDDSGQTIRLSALWREHPLVLIFLRHLG